ncbi:polysaccharide deacetylase family protein [Acetobacteroides hydrogenigenes]|uniref:Polysaccharide deacetylase n=1 Tax=Acetobacteroides hydrogenigenes TaxID=979970 RepID=A0A4R2E497_9BACT|nr:hypothetical protein [Acetobacteroides hydrogenigenes]TCN62207.1 hypothetical protein CLV25_11940 [Acetobacteroides hydrogenigenes]
MKVIVSHDIDHLSVTDHFKDLILPKFLIRNFIELITGHLSKKEFFDRFFKLFLNKWQNIKEIHAFNLKNGVKETFFIGVNNGKGLSYSFKKARKWIEFFHENKIQVGVHGINYRNYEDITIEFEKFKSIIKDVDFGIRMHYLRTNESTFKNLSAVGYMYDSSLMMIKDVYKIGNMYEFPLHIMDGVVCGNRKFSDVSIEEAKLRTINIIQKAKEEQVQYLTVLFHDRYFDDSFSLWKDWYIWLIKFLKDQGFEFISYVDAIKEIESNECK